MKVINVAKLKNLLKGASDDTLISEDGFKIILNEYGEEWFYDRAEDWSKAEEEEEYEKSREDGSRI